MFSCAKKELNFIIKIQNKQEFNKLHLIIYQTLTLKNL